MDAESKEYLKLRSDIKEEVVDTFKKYLKIFDWDIPETDDNEASKLIAKAMREALAELEDEIKEGKYNNF